MYAPRGGEGSPCPVCATSNHDEVLSPLSGGTHYLIAAQKGAYRHKKESYMADWDRWESVVRSDPRRAWRVGPPNLMVKGRVKKGELFLDAALRVKLADFKRLNPSWNVPGSVPDVPGDEGGDGYNVPTPDVPTDMSLHSNDVPTEDSKVVVPSDSAVRPAERLERITAGLCADCGVGPREGRYRTCSACRKKAYRARRKE